MDAQAGRGRPGRALGKETGGKGGKEIAETKKKGGSMRKRGVRKGRGGLRGGGWW